MRWKTPISTGNWTAHHFESQLTAWVELSKLVEQARPLIYEGKDKAMVQTQAAIYWTLTDSLPILLGSDTVYSQPLGYDFSDVWGREEWANMFVSKLMETGKGNCHSLPMLYKLIADARGVPAWLALAPNHFYLKLHNEVSGWYNIELTSSLFPIDAWIMASGYVHLDAIRNSMYMDTLSNRENIGVCLVDLAQGYQAKYGFGDGQFVLQCCEKALEAFPNYINALLLQAEAERRLFMASSTAPESANSGPQSSFEALQNRYLHIHRLGYRQMPASMYADWIESLRAQRTNTTNHYNTNPQ
jgi:hypothetical protein